MNADMQAFLTLGMTGILAITSIGMMIASVYLARETSLQRKAGIAPDVVGYLLPDDRHTNVIRFHLKNVGHGPALRVGFEVLGDTSGFSDAGVRLEVVQGRPPMAALPQGDGVSTFFGVGHELFKDPVPVSVRITYESVTGQRTSKDVVLDVRQFDGFCSVGTRPEDDIATSLKKIERHLERLGGNSNRLHVIAASPEVWQEQDDLARQRREEHFRQLRDASAKAAD